MTPTERSKVQFLFGKTIEQEDEIMRKKQLHQNEREKLEQHQKLELEQFCKEKGDHVYISHYIPAEYEGKDLGGFTIEVCIFCHHTKF